MGFVRVQRGISRWAFWGLAGVALLLAHDAVYLVQIGPGEELAMALRAAGHAYWGTASVLLGAIGAACALAYGLRLRLLRRRARELAVDPAPAAGRGIGRLAATWARLFAIIAVGFTIQENLEHAFGHGHLIGLGALIGPEYPLALPILALVTGFAALLAVAVTGVEDSLVLAIAEGLRRVERPPRLLRRRPAPSSARRRSPLAGAAAGRAPPTLLVPAS
jgi:hypothetical protein